MNRAKSIPLAATAIALAAGVWLSTDKPASDLPPLPAPVPFEVESSMLNVECSPLPTFELASPIPGNPLYVAVETSPDARTWTETYRWWNDYIRADYTIAFETYPTEAQKFYRWKICYRP